MKKLNNKGFAITTIVYGLSILGIMLIAMLMSIMSVTRSNTKEMSQTIKDDLNNFSRSQVVFYSKEEPQEYKIPDDESGWYKIELWGAQGNIGDNYEGGAYTSGIIELKEGDTLYFKVGKSKEGQSGEATTVHIKREDNTDGPIMSAAGGKTDTASYISGYGGCNRPEGSPYFVDGMMISNLNAEDGIAKIERVLEKNNEKEVLKKVNEQLNGEYRYIRDCISNTTPEDAKVWQKISVMSNGVDVATGKTLSDTTVGNQICKLLDIGKSVPIDEITVWHKPAEYKNHTIEVLKDDSTWSYIKKSNDSISEIESVNGVRISAYQYSSALPKDGNYYIMPATSDKEVITARDKTNINNPVVIDNIRGLKRQKWSVVLKNKSENLYVLVELSRFNSLTLTNQDNELKVLANQNLEEGNNNQIWKINAVGDGTYTISPTIPSDNPEVKRYIVPQTSHEGGHFNELMIGSEPAINRFKFISLNYSKDINNN